MTALTERVLKAMLLTRIKTAVAITLAAGATITGLGLLASRASGTPAPIAQEARLPSTEAPGPFTPLAKSTATSGSATDPAAQTEQSPLEASDPVFTMGDSKKIWVYDPARKSWHTYKAPEGVSVSPHTRVPEFWSP